MLTCGLEEGHIVDLDLEVLEEKLRHVLQCLRLSCGGKLLSFLMSQVAIEEVSIAKEVAFRSRLLLRLFLVLRRRIALEVVLPRLHADPAKLMATATRLAAGHVHAAAILFYGVVALGAKLGIHFDPQHIRSFVAVFGLPQLDRLTLYRFVDVVAAGETPVKTTWAMYLAGSRIGGGSLAAWSGAPLDASCRIIHQALGQKPAKTPGGGWIEKLGEAAGTNQLLASGCRAVEVQTAFAL